MIDFILYFICGYSLIVCAVIKCIETQNDIDNYRDNYNNFNYGLHTYEVPLEPNMSNNLLDNLINRSRSSISSSSLSDIENNKNLYNLPFNFSPDMNSSNIINEYRRNLFGEPPANSI